ELEQKAKLYNLRDRIIFTGHYERSHAGVIYASADIFAFPSLTDTQGLVLHEAAGAGLPLVLCDKNVSEIFHNHRNGLLADDDPEDFANKIVQILTDKNLRSKMSTSSIEFATGYTESKQIADLEKLYNRLSSNHKHIKFAGSVW
ncbi:MAG: glycosyltransferase, partial [Chryseobacterium sp.]